MTPKKTITSAGACDHAKTATDTNKIIACIAQNVFRYTYNIQSRFRCCPVPSSAQDEPSKCRFAA
jgi:hypothetical protein